MRSHLAAIDEMLDGRVGDALKMVTPTGRDAPLTNDCGRRRGRVCH
jgi:hypothetical protein